MNPVDAFLSGKGIGIGGGGGGHGVRSAGKFFPGGESEAVHFQFQIPVLSGREKVDLGRQGKRGFKEAGGNMYAFAEGRVAGCAVRVFAKAYNDVFRAADRHVVLPETSLVGQDIGRCAPGRGGKKAIRQ